MHAALKILGISSLFTTFIGFSANEEVSEYDVGTNVHQKRTVIEPEADFSKFQDGLSGGGIRTACNDYIEEVTNDECPAGSVIIGKKIAKYYKEIFSTLDNSTADNFQTNLRGLGEQATNHLDLLKKEHAKRLQHKPVTRNIHMLSMIADYLYTFEENINTEAAEARPSSLSLFTAR